MGAKRGARRQRNWRPSDCRGAVHHGGTSGDHEPELVSAEFPRDSRSFLSYRVSNGLDGTLPQLVGSGLRLRRVPSWPRATVTGRCWRKGALPFPESSHTAAVNVTDGEYPMHPNTARHALNAEYLLVGGNGGDGASALRSSNSARSRPCARLALRGVCWPHAIRWAWLPAAAASTDSGARSIRLATA